MKITITGRKMTITEGIREAVMKKLSKLDKFFDEAEAHVTLRVEKETQIAEVTISSNGMLFRAEEGTEDMYRSIDALVPLLERQIRKNKTRLEKRLRTPVVLEIPEEEAPVEEYRIVRKKVFHSKPMTPEEAVLQMNLLGHEFFIFLNSETGKSAMVYRRKDKNYGLIDLADD